MRSDAISEYQLSENRLWAPGENGMVKLIPDPYGMVQVHPFLDSIWIVLQWNPVNADTRRTCHTVRIIRVFHRYKDYRRYFYDKTFENFPAVSPHGRESKIVDSGLQSLVGFQIPELYSGFQSPRFRIPQAKFFPIPESGFPYMRRTVPITRGEGWEMYSRFQMKGMIESGQLNQNPPKIPRASNKT